MAGKGLQSLCFLPALTSIMLYYRVSLAIDLADAVTQIKGNPLVGDHPRLIIVKEHVDTNILGKKLGTETNASLSAVIIRAEFKLGRAGLSIGLQ
jgi:hypothetical protein